MTKIGVVKTKVWYLEMLFAPTYPDFKKKSNCRVKKIIKPSLVVYKKLYDEVGLKWNWYDRTIMPGKELLSIIQNPKVEVWILLVNNAVAGYIELDKRVKGQVEISLFGLKAHYIGRGYGTYFLRLFIKKQWSLGIKRLWLNTCDLDHRSAMHLYLKAGFKIYDEKIRSQKILK